MEYEHEYYSKILEADVTVYANLCDYGMNRGNGLTEKFPEWIDLEVWNLTDGIERYVLLTPEMTLEVEDALNDMDEVWG